MGWNEKLFGWLRSEPDAGESEDLKDAEADQIDEEYSAEKADANTELRFGRGMHDPDV
jgi:hypothetical protein